MEILIEGTLVHIDGSASDSYFLAAQDIANAMASIMDMIMDLPENPTILDVGANIGLTSIAMAIRRPDARIISFEPSPTLSSYLRSNVARFENVEVVQAAVSDEDGFLEFHTDTFGAGSHVMVAGGLLRDPEGDQVRAVKLDTIVAEMNLTPDFIKIDVEGHEPEVLVGGAEMIERLNPKIYMEFNTWTLIVVSGHSPDVFAKAVWKAFDVAGYPEALEFLHENLTVKACVSDILMQLKPGAVVPSLFEMSVSPMARKLSAIEAMGTGA